MIVIKYNLTFRLQEKARKDSSAPAEAHVRCDVTWEGHRVRLNVGQVVNVEGWSAEMQRCKPRSTHGKLKTPAASINAILNEYELMLEGIFRQAEQDDTVPSKEAFKKAVAVATGKGKEESAEDNSIFPIYDKFIQDGIKTARWREATLKKIRIVRQHLHDINPRMTFDDLDRDGIAMMVSHLSTRSDKRSKKGLRNPTIDKEITVAKSFVRWAVEKGYREQSTFIQQKSKLKNATKTIVFLDWEELMRVYHYDFSDSPRLDQVRDAFCFSCFTSLRYSDVFNLKRADVDEKNETISVTTIKTDDKLTIELNKYSKAILQKYWAYAFPDGKALPTISNQKMNDYLKEIGRICGINKPVVVNSYKGTKRIQETFKKYELLSTHAGRRTFISNALMLGISPEIVRRWSGHSDFKAMKPYMEMVDEVKRQAMSAFDNVGQKVGQKCDIE